MGMDIHYDFVPKEANTEKLIHRMNLNYDFQCSKCYEDWWKFCKILRENSTDIYINDQYCVLDKDKFSTIADEIKKLTVYKSEAVKEMVSELEYSYDKEFLEENIFVVFISY